MAEVSESPLSTTSRWSTRARALLPLGPHEDQVPSTRTLGGLCVGVETPIPLRLDLGEEAWPITRRLRGLIRLLRVSRKETRCGDQAGFWSVRIGIDIVLSMTIVTD